MPIVPYASAYDSKVRLYALANPVLFAEQSDALTRFVFEALQVTPSNRQRVYISPSSAFLEYTALDELWNRRSPPALPSKAEALKAAQEVLTRLEQRCSDANRAWPAPLRGLALLPPVNMLRLTELDAVPRPDGSALDHWLYRAEPQLPLDGGLKTRVGVFDAQVKVCVGHRGQPISVRSRWTPLSGEKKLTDLSPFRPPLGEKKNATSGSKANGTDPVIKFLLEGHGFPQYYLAPYYFRIDRDRLSMVSASPFSLTVDVGYTEQGTSRMTLTAFARGGSGKYTYNWAVYSMARIDAGIREIGPGSMQTLDGVDGRVTVSSIEIENGSYVVLLNVKDLATGAFKHHQHPVLPREGSGDGSGAGPAGGASAR